MDEIGLFPLGIVLLPTEQVPLHIFEPRYRELIGESLEHGYPFGIIHADDNGGLRRVGTLAAVTEVVERFEDGRLNVIVEGGSRFRLVGMTEGRTFATGRVEPVDDAGDPADPADVDRALTLFARLVELTTTEVAPPSPDTPALSYAIAGLFDFSTDIKQELLEESSERLRLTRLCELLELAAEAVQRQQKVASRAQTNGKVEPPA